MSGVSAALLGTAGRWRAEGQLCFSPHTRARSLEEPRALPGQWQCGGCHSSVLAALPVPLAPSPRPRTFTNHVSHFSHVGAASGAGRLTPTLSSPLAGRAGGVQSVACLQPSWLAHERGKKELS